MTGAKYAHKGQILSHPSQKSCGFGYARRGFVNADALSFSVRLWYDIFAKRSFDNTDMKQQPIVTAVGSPALDALSESERGIFCEALLQHISVFAEREQREPPEAEGKSTSCLSPRGA